MSFTNLGVRPRTAEALLRQRIVDPNAVQTSAIPPLLEGHDVVIEAPTGSGKTLAFGVPLIERLSGHQPRGARALIVVPTRELAQQVAAVIRSVDSHLHVATIVGGVGYRSQYNALHNSPDVVVGCPGRLLDLAAQDVLDLRRINYLVLDEADEMLDQGFARDVERIIALCPESSSRQTVLASATMPAWVQTMIQKHLRSPERIKIAAEETTLEHAVLRIRHAEKNDVLETLLTEQRRCGSQTIVFHRTKHGVKKLSRDLVKRGFQAVELQGNLSQNARDRAIGSFRNNRAEVLVATNVAARGIDVANVGLVINSELPETAQWLTHRIGRTARNGAAGRAITFLSELDGAHWNKLRRAGAPALPELHRNKLLQEGAWSLMPEQNPVSVDSGTPRPRPVNNWRRNHRSPRARTGFNAGRRSQPK